MTPAEWLTAKASSYHADARALEIGSPVLVGTGLTCEQWAIVYRAVASELRQCAREVDLNQEEP